MLATHSEGAEGIWDGWITMNEDVPGYGAGVYLYADRIDCGLHQIQVNENDHAIYVHGERTCGPGARGGVQFSYVWRRLDKEDLPPRSVLWSLVSGLFRIFRPQ